jgi:hypothetical protein
MGRAAVNRPPTTHGRFLIKVYAEGHRFLTTLLEIQARQDGSADSPSRAEPFPAEDPANRRGSQFSQQYQLKLLGGRWVTKLRSEVPSATSSGWGW